MRGVAAGLVLGVLASLSWAALATDAPPETAWEGGAALYVARLVPNESASHLDNGSDAFAFGATITFPYGPNLDIDVDFNIAYRRYDTPPIADPLFGTVNDTMALTTMAVTVGPKLFLGDRLTRMHASVNAGLYHSRLNVSGQLFGFPGTYDEETSTAPGLEVHIGADLRTSATKSIGIEVRRVWLRGDFDELSSGDADIGGVAVTLTRRWWVRAR